MKFSPALLFAVAAARPHAARRDSGAAQTRRTAVPTVDAATTEGSTAADVRGSACLTRATADIGIRDLRLRAAAAPPHGGSGGTEPTELSPTPTLKNHYFGCG